jgi:hypothetical protein
LFRLLLIFYNETTFFRYVLGIIENKKIKLSWKDFVKQFFVKRILRKGDNKKVLKAIDLKSLIKL